MTDASRPTVASGTDASLAVGRVRGLQLIRVGWTVAELRGRTFLGKASDPGSLLTPIRTGHALPLAQERSTGERLRSTQAAFTVLGDQLQLPVSSDGMVDRSHTAPVEANGWHQVANLSQQVPHNQDDAAWRASWNAFSEAIYLLDERVQDTLTSATYGEVSSYLLGRALGETSWALDPSATAGDFPSWEYLLGSERALTITEMIERLTPNVIPDPVSQAICGSLKLWQETVLDREVPSDPDTTVPRRNPANAVLRLRQQSDLWRDLLLSGASFDSIIPTQAKLFRLSSIRQIFRMLAPQVAVGVISAAFLGAVAWFMTSHQTASGPLGAIIAALSVLGLTGSSLSAKAKSEVNDALANLKSSLSSDLIVERATILPDGSKNEPLTKISVTPPGGLSRPLSASGLRSSPRTETHVPPSPVGGRTPAAASSATAPATTSPTTPAT